MTMTKEDRAAEKTQHAAEAKQRRAELTTLRAAKKKIERDAIRAARDRAKLARQITVSAHRAIKRIGIDHARAGHAVEKQLTNITRRIGIVEGRQT
jgi:hypothetical protein